MGVSQLKRLKARLNESGLRGSSMGLKKRRRTNAGRDKDTRREAAEAIREEFRPFEVKVNRQKVDVQGRRVRGSTGRPALNKQVGEESRKRTLLVELERKNKVGKIVDRRFGENNPHLTPEEKMLERYASEKRNKASRGSLFNLEDDEEPDEYQLTHLGQTLEEDQEEFAEGDLGVDTVADGEQDGQRPQKDVYQEVIAKSKMYKLERQQAKAQDEEAITKLDEELDSIRSLLFSTDAQTPSTKTGIVGKDKEYDDNVKQLLYDKRSQPSTRTKTEEELAREEAEHLQDLERQRLRRMNGEVISSDEEEDNDYEQKEPQSKITNIERGPDELDDDFDYNEATSFGFGAGLEGEESDQDNSSESSHEGSQSELEEAFDEDDYRDLLSEEEHEVNGAESSVQQLKPKPSLSNGKAELSLTGATKYMFSCPENLEEFLSILAPYPLPEHPTIIDRIIKLHHPSLKEGNKEKLAKFSQIVLDYILYLANQAETDPAVTETIVSITRDLAERFPTSVGARCRKHLEDLGKRITVLSSIKDSSTNLDHLEKSDALLLLMIGTMFSTSDHFHLVATPAMITMGQYLAQIEIKGVEDLAAKLFLCDVIANYQRLSKRYVPEVTNFLAQALIVLGPPGIVQSTPAWSNISLHGIRNQKFDVSQVPVPVDMDSVVLRLDYLNGNFKDEDMQQVKAKLLAFTLKLVGRFSSLWIDHEAFIEVLQPVSNIIKVLIKGGYDKSVPKIILVQDKLDRQLRFAKEARKPLALQHHRPLPIATHAPKFEERYNVDRKSYDPDDRRRELAKLKSLVKKEKKGALRELRKDTAFVSRFKIDDKRKKDDEYHATQARLLRSIATEEGQEKNAYEREKRARKSKR